MVGLPGVAQTGQEQKAEADRLLQQGNQQYQISQFTAALQSWQQALNLYRQIKDRSGERVVLDNLGLAYQSLGNYAASVDLFQQKLALDREIGNRAGERDSLLSLGWAYNFRGQYQQAIEFFQQTLAMSRGIGDRGGEASSLYALGWTYDDLGQYQKSVELYQEAFKIAHQINDQSRMANILNGLGWVHNSLGKYQQAINFFQQQLSIAEEKNYLWQKANAFNGLGWSFRALKQYSKAISFSQQALTIHKQIGDSREEAYSLRDLGKAFAELGESQEAIEFYQRALAIQSKIGNRWGEGVTLNDIADLLVQQSQPELAIVFYKQSVNVRESIRQDLRKLDRTLQESYANSVAGTYRRLADLLLAQGRVLEAQQALELLKIRELRDYTRDARAGGETKGAPLNAVEAPVKPPFDTSIALGLKLTECENQRPRCVDRDQLLAQRQAAIEQFNQQKDRLRRLARQQGSQDPAQLQQEELTVAAAKVVQAQPKTVLIYPLVLEDKLWLVYGVQAGKAGVVFASQEIPVSRKELSATVAEFRTLLENPSSDVKQLQQVSQKLYGWLIAPLRPQLDANGIQNLVFSLDRSTRYMPLAALFDGKQYLAERFTLSTILTAGLTNTTDKLSSNPADNPVLGLGLSDAVSGFDPLPNVPAEIAAIVRPKSNDTNGIFQGSAYLNRDFTLKAFKNLIDYRILHIATHGKFEEDPEQSFLVLGNGDRLTVPNILQLTDLGNIHLAVLSACETAKGGQDKEGIEVAGLSYYFLKQNVKSVMASLWLVNDASTSVLMQQFYKQLATGKVTKAEALRQVQLSFLQGKLTAKDAPDRAGGRRDRSGQLPVGSFAHPFYWAPFILIGNGL
jgi:CHAT domain-containing protein